MAPTPAATAPATHKQPSRKGKTAWRKNVDITEVQTGLEDVRDEIVKHGGVVAEKSADQLFATDLTGDADIVKKAKGTSRPLKADQILGMRSAVPGLDGRKRKADEVAAVPTASKRYKSGDYVKHKDLQRLKNIADNGEIAVEESPAHDPWAETTVVKDPRFSYLDEVKPMRAPTTLTQAPMSLAASGKPFPNIRKSDAGKSYNPLVTDWSALLEREGLAAVEAEETRLATESEAAAREARALAEADKVDKQDRDEYGTDYESAWESEWEGFQSGAEGDKGEVHVQKVSRRKTPAERNKVKARKEREAREKWEKKQKLRDVQEKRIAQISKEMSVRDKARNASRAVTLQTTPDSSESEIDDREVAMQRRRFGKLPIPDAPLEVVLPDELQDSLRRLKPEGNLLTDRYRNLLVNGKVEVRKKNFQWKQGKTERLEKWSYKDWELK